MSNNDDDKDLWDLATQDVKPLAPGSDQAPNTALKQTTPSKTAPKIQPAARHQNTVKRAQSSDIDGSTDDKLRRGRMAIEARLDLHGMSQADAFDAVQNFILNAYHGEKRCVLIVTGKGGYSSSDPDNFFDPQIKVGVLKSNFPHWMDDPTLRNFILKFYPAQPKHGGGGAFYVLVRRKR
jgi:DNA-nicking Smr family endonuclease